jgi:cytochrome c-type biogenesis protein CcmH
MKACRMKAVLALLLLLVSALAAPVFSNAASAAATAADTFSDPAMEARARNLQRQFRCLVCAGENVDESGSPFSADVRRLIREQIAAGQSDAQVQDFLVARYGDVILMKPPVQPDTWLLWLAPFLVLGAGGAVAWVVVKKAAARSA